MLDVRALTIRSAERILVQDLSVSLPSTGITALIGPSGCGKTTVLRWLAGIPTPGLHANGTARLDGAPIARPNPAISYQPQSDALFPWLTIAENAALGVQVAGRSRRAALAHVTPFFAPFGLAGCETLYPGQLSGGMRQRAAFLRTIVQDSRFVLLDEPFSALDAVTRLRMQDWLLRRLHDSPRAILMVTHDLHEATILADRIIVMAADPGRIIAEIPVLTAHNDRSETHMAPLRERLKSLLLKESPR